MRAFIVNPGARSARLGERAAPPAPRGSEVLLRILEVGICGTDREICRFEYGTPPVGQTEFILGHEALARVVAAGPEVTAFRAGELVVPMVRRPCSSPGCRACRAGRQDFCSSNGFSECGIVRADGFLAEHVLVEERYLIAVPEGLREVAVLVEPLSVISKAAAAYAAIHARLAFEAPQSSGLVLGAGAVGLLVAMSMRAHGFETYVFSRESECDERAAMVSRLGCHYVSSERTAVEQLSDRIGSVDLIFEAVGIPEVAWSALSALAPNGVCALTGVPALGTRVRVDLRRRMRELVLNNQLVFGTVNAGLPDYRRSVRRLQQLLTLFPAELTGLVRRVPLNQVNEAIADRQGIKDVVSILGAA